MSKSPMAQTAPKYLPPLRSRRNYGVDAACAAAAPARRGGHVRSLGQGPEASGQRATEDRPHTRKAFPMSNAAVYIRVSDEHQGKGHSLVVQRTDCLAQAHGDGFLVDDERIYRDEGFSATTAMDRPAFQQLLTDAKA